MVKEKKQRSAAQIAAEKKYNAKRESRYMAWTFIFYESSAPDCWRDFLNDLHLKVWVSPIHDRDKWTKKDEAENPKHVFGSEKKPHRHIIVEYPNKATLSEVQEDFSDLSMAIAGNKFVRVKDLVSLVRYLTHKDDPDKAQYDVSDIEVFGGANLDLYEELGKGEIRAELRAMRKHIRDNDITEFDLFWDYCDDCMENWSRILDDRCYGIEKYIKARRSRKRDEIKQMALNVARLQLSSQRFVCEYCGRSYSTREELEACLLTHQEGFYE